MSLGVRIKGPWKANRHLPAHEIVIARKPGLNKSLVLPSLLCVWNVLVIIVYAWEYGTRLICVKVVRKFITFL